MRKPIIAGNWKMFKTISEAIELANGLKRALFDIEGVDIIICPPFTALADIAEVIYDSNIQLGAQDMYWDEKGAYTGEISGLMLKDIGVKFIIIGHSERRQLFGEDNKSVNRKVITALKIGLKPIVCVGENLEERQKNKTLAVVKDHIEKGLESLGKEDILNTVIAYEPVWAIGTGKTATPEQAQEVQRFIRSMLSKMYNEDVASRVRIQYGGSVRVDNIKELMQQEDIDGALVGGASLEINSFAEIVKNSIIK